MSLFSSLNTLLAKTVIRSKAKKGKPQFEGKLCLPGLENSVEVIRDQWGVPHIYARSKHDMLMTQGFVHAQDRMWQMEINRRLATGRLCEILGPLALDTDRLTRTMGFNRLAEQDAQAYDPSLTEMMDAYVEGINAYISNPGKAFPVEFQLLKYEPEPWTRLDSLAFSRMMIWEMSFVWYHSIVRAKIIEKVGEEAAAELEIEYSKDNPVKLPNGIEFNKIEESGMLQALQGPYLNPLGGSNAWAVSANLTNTEKPILCNDPHLPLMLPGIWYEAHMQSAGYHCTGVSIPGLPLIMIGHNEHIAWGITLAFTDLQDLFVERFSDESCVNYEFQGALWESTIHEETIKIKDGADHIERVIETHHGPVISDVIDIPQQKVTLCSKALQPISSLQGWQEINQAKNWDEFVKSCKHIGAPGLNITYADVAGNIGYWVTGEVPVRKTGQGMVPVPGWTGEYEWIDSVPFDEMPHLFNPEKGWFVTCNHKIVEDNYPHFLGNAWMNGYRARRMEDLLQSKTTFTTEDLGRFHMDLFCIPGKQFAQHYLTITTEDSKVEKARKMLVEWDGVLDTKTIGGTLYQVTKHFLIHNIVDPVLGAELAREFRGGGYHPIMAPMTEFMGHDSVALLRMLNKPSSWWIEKSGGKEFVLRKALTDAVTWLKDEVSSDIEKWQWGKLHAVEFSHTMSAQAPLDKVFNLGPIDLGGDTDTVCQTAFRPHEPYGQHIVGPSYRQVINLEDFTKSKSVMPPGQSGDLTNPHYNSQIELWLNGEYHPMCWSREQVERHAAFKLELAPE